MTQSCRHHGQLGSKHFFLACDGSTSYLCHPKHRDGSRNSQWNVSMPDECHIFCQSQTLNSFDNQRPGYWYVSVGARDVIGTKKQRLAFFEQPVNATDAWHGYPVGGTHNSGDPHYPPTDIINDWYMADRIPRHVADKFNRGKL